MEPRLRSGREVLWISESADLAEETGPEPRGGHVLWAGGVGGPFR